MKKILGLIFVVSISGLFTACSEKKDVVNKDIKIEYNVLEDKEVNEVKKTDLYLEHDYKVKKIEIKDETLIIEVDADLKTFEEVYALGSFISEYIKTENKTKLDLYEISNENTIFTSENSSWLYDGSTNIKKLK